MSDKPESTEASAKEKAKKNKSPGSVTALSNLKFLRVPLLCLLVLLIGLWIGYSKIGGQPVSEIFQMKTWKHLYDLVFA
jgi:hypothetical protein